MSKFLQFVLIVLVGILFLSTASYTQKKSVPAKKSDPVSKAMELMKNYKPPVANNPQPTETPQQAWKKLYDQELNRSKTPSKPLTGGPVTPKASQYRKPLLSPALQQKATAKKLTPAEIRQQGLDQIRQAEASGKGESYELKQRRLSSQKNMTPAEIKQATQNFARQEEQNGRGAAWELKKRNITLPDQLTPAQQQQKAMDAVRNHPMKEQSSLNPWDTKALRQFIETSVPDINNRHQRVTSSYTGGYSGTVYKDDNHNNVMDSAEVGLAGWRVYSYEYYSGKYDTVTTDADGNYFFNDTISTYSPYFYVYEIQQTGYYETQPGHNSYYGFYINGDTVRNNNFGNFKNIPVVVSGWVFNDENKNGVKDSNEVGLANWQINLYNYATGWNYLYTDSTGFWSYSYNDTTTHTQFQINQTDQQGWLRTTSTYLYPQGWGSENNNVNFGNWAIGRHQLSGRIYNDANKNSTFDTTETGLFNWQITIYRYQDGHTFNLYTDSTGSWVFSDSGFASYYNISETKPNGWLQTQQTSYYQIYSAGDSTAHLDFGNFLIPWNQISGNVYSDLNHNSTLDAGDTSLANWQITIYRYYDGQTFYINTDSLGNYTYRDSGYASYYNVTETNQSGWLQTQPSSYYQYYKVGDTTSNANFGNWLVPLSSIRGSVWNDLNNNGQRDSGDVGLAGWKIFAYDESTSLTDTAVTDSNGNYQFDSLTWVSYYQVSERPPLDWIKTYPGGAYWRPYVAGDTVSNNDFGNYLPPQGALRVNIMPSNAVNGTYANAIAGQALNVWGNVHGGLVPLHYTLDYGDGTIDSGLVTDRHFVGNLHAYETGGPKTVTLRILDANGNSQSKQAIVRVYAVGTLQIKVNMAIEHGLLFNYLNQYPSGYWTSGYGNVGSTGAALLAFEENGHLPGNDITQDIYAEYIQAGLNYLFGNVSNYGIYAQEAGNPDSNGDGYGAYFDGSEQYANGLASLAVIASRKSANEAKADTIQTGAYSGKTIYDLMVNVIDQIAFSQTDSSAGGYRGGWRYTVATSGGDADNSAAQWPGLVLESAENSWGMAVPQFVKTEFLKWLQYSQDGTGGFGYTGPSYWNNIAKTGAGIGGYASLGYTTDSVEVSNAINFIATHFNDAGDGNGYAEALHGNLYAMYAVAKGLRIINHRVPVSDIGAHNWYNEYADHLINDPTWGQKADGSWDDAAWTGSYANSRPLSAAFAVLILTQGVIVPPPVAIIAPLDAKPPNTSFTVDGSGSFHQDPNKSIIEWLWDFNSGDGIDWNHPDASGPVPTNPGYANEGTYTITLRVKDNSDPPMYSVNTVNVLIKAGHHSPVAVAIPPSRGGSYAAKVGEPLLLDGRSSYSPDFPQDSVVAYNWDLNGDGIFGDSHSDTVTVVFPNEHQGQVGLRVYDATGDSSSNVAYITIVASKRDLSVDQFTATPSKLYTNGSIRLWAKFKNDQNSNVDANNVLVRFYDDNPLTVGNRLGGDFLVNLPVGGSDTAATTINLSSRIGPGIKHFFVYLDANNNFAEWDEQNNIDSIEVEVDLPPPHIIFAKECLNFATLAVGDSMMMAFPVGNDGIGPLFVDSISLSSPDFMVGTVESTVVSPGVTMNVPIWFKPSGSGWKDAIVTVYTNDGAHTVHLTGQGMLAATGTGQQIFSGLASVDGAAVPPGTVVGAFRLNGDLIVASLIQVAPESVENGINYSLSLLEGQDGIADGDTIVFGITTLNCENIWERYCQPRRWAIFHPSSPPVNGYTPHDIDGVHMTRMSIPVSSGFNSVSWNLWLTNDSVTTVFGNLLATNKVSVLLDFINDGSGNPRFDYYIPQLGDYSPFYWTNYQKGYFVRLRNDVNRDSLVVNGFPICPTAQMMLDSGYNYISYIPQYADSTSNALSNMSEDNLALALDWNNQGNGKGSFDMYPNGPFTTMMPGKGYFVNVNAGQMFSYPDNSILPAKTAHKKITPATIAKVKAAKPKKINSAQPGSVPQAMFAYGKKLTINGKLVPKGTEVKAVDNNGIVCGTSKFAADGVFSIAIYADDPATPIDEGANVGEAVKLYINNSLIAQEVKWTGFGDVTIVDGAQTLTGVLYSDALPKAYALQQNYPNPFNPTTTIRYELPKLSHVVLKIYNMLGQEVRTMEESDQLPGYYQTVWDGRNNEGLSVSSGIYTYRLVATSDKTTFVDTHKMILIK